MNAWPHADLMLSGNVANYVTCLSSKLIIRYHDKTLKLVTLTLVTTVNRKREGIIITKIRFRLYLIILTWKAEYRPARLGRLYEGRYRLIGSNSFICNNPPVNSWARTKRDCAHRNRPPVSSNGNIARLIIVYYNDK